MSVDREDAVAGNIVLAGLDRPLSPLDQQTFLRRLGVRLLHASDPEAWSLGSRIVRDDPAAPALLRVVRRRAPAVGVDIDLAWIGGALDPQVIDECRKLVNGNLAYLEYQISVPVSADLSVSNSDEFGLLASLMLNDLETWLAQVNSEALARSQGHLAKTLFYLVPALRKVGYSDEVHVEADLDLETRRAVLMILLWPQGAVDTRLRASVRGADGVILEGSPSVDGLVQFERVAVTESSPSDLELRFLLRGVKPLP